MEESIPLSFEEPFLETKHVTFIFYLIGHHGLVTGLCLKATPIIADEGENRYWGTAHSIRNTVQSTLNSQGFQVLAIKIMIVVAHNGKATWQSSFFCSTWAYVLCGLMGPQGWTG